LSKGQRTPATHAGVTSRLICGGFTAGDCGPGTVRLAGLHGRLTLSETPRPRGGLPTLRISTSNRFTYPPTGRSHSSRRLQTIHRRVIRAGNQSSACQADQPGHCHSAKSDRVRCPKQFLTFVDPSPGATGSLPASVHRTRAALADKLPVAPRLVATIYT